MASLVGARPLIELRGMVFDHEKGPYFGSFWPFQGEGERKGEGLETPQRGLKTE